MEDSNAAEWVRFGDNDIAVAELTASNYPQMYEIICYHCQQSAEKYLKGFLVFNGIDEPPRVHNLSYLCVLCSEFDAGFTQTKNLCDFLTAFGVQPRYPDEIYIDEGIALKAIDYARQFRDSAPMAEFREKLKVSAT